jgi:hypothetical protein
VTKLIRVGARAEPAQADCGRHDVDLCRLEPAHHHIVPVTAAVASPRTWQAAGLRRRM